MPDRLGYLAFVPQQLKGHAAAELWLQTHLLLQTVRPEAAAQLQGLQPCRVQHQPEVDITMSIMLWRAASMSIGKHAQYQQFSEILMWSLQLTLLTLTRNLFFDESLRDCVSSGSARVISADGIHSMSDKTGKSLFLCAFPS